MNIILKYYLFHETIQEHVFLLKRITVILFFVIFRSWYFVIEELRVFLQYFRYFKNFVRISF